MTNATAAVILGAGILSLPLSASADEPEWTLAHEEDGLVVRYRDRVDLGGRQVRAEAYVDSPPAKVFEVLDAPEKYTEFMPYLEKLEVLERFPDGRLQYEVINPPIVSRRDYVLRITVTKAPDEGRYRIDWKPVTDKGPAASEDIVRITVNEGAYELLPEGKGTKLVYTLLTHPGGSIPSWIAKRTNTSSVPDLIDRIRRRSADPKWKPN